ncbi:MAG: right-handed parallel beta-helix repeat-containing protein, partial [Kiritimatiellae bacterium]|nr:right-handed parallel beta-helix repeat-containing protein [Kiritimatiellia bacterium]
MIRPATGAATFYATLGAAMDVATDGGTVMLANDCTEGLALNKAGTYIFDTMGFAASDEVSVADGLFIKSSTSVDSSAKVLVADAKATTYVVARKVAGVGEQFYDNLAEAVAAANGAVVTLYAETDETITLTAEGQSFTLNKNGIAFDDAKVVTTIANGSVTKSATDAGTVYTAVTSVVDASDGNKYASVGAAVATVEGNDVSVTVTANITESVTLPQGKALTVKNAEGVEANVTVTPAEGAFLVESAVEGGTKYESKRITETYSGEEAALSGNGAIVRADNAASAELKEIAVTLVSTEKTGGAIRKATFEVTPKDANGEAMGGELSGSYVFRLPVDAAATQLSAVVYHGEAQFGVYGVQSWDGAKFIEVESSSFSPYAYELLDGETANPVAAIGTTGYATLADAIAAVPTDGTETTITMIAGETLASSVTFPANTKIVLDLNGQTIDNQTTGFAFASGTSPARFTFIVNGDLTVKDSATGGNISIAKANNATTKAFYVNGMLTVDGGAISADYSAAYVNANGEMIVNGGVVHGDSYGININKSNGHVTINGGSVTASGEATLCTNGNEGIANLGVYDINAGTIENTGAGAAIYNPNRGTTINIHAPAVITGGTGIVMKGGTLNVDGGTISGTGAFAAPSAVNSGFTTTGDALYVEDTYSTGGINFKPTVNITGGTFNSANGYAAQYYTQATAVTESQANGSINISGNPTLTSAKQTDTAASTEIPGKINIAGGSFTHAVPEEYCADGYIPAAQDTNTGLYSVKTGSYVAQVGTAKYETLEAAIAAANDGDTIEMLADDNVSLTGGARLTIDKSLTITGPVDTNGEPLYTIYGTPAQTGTNNIYIDGSGTVTLSNLKIKDFGNNKGTDGAHAPVYVASSFTGTVNLDNLYISDFNRGGVFLYGGTFNVTDCYIDCANSRSDAFTKGIEIKGAATGTIKDTVIVNMERSNATYSTAGIEVYGNGTITVDGCTILSDVDPHQSVKGTYGIVSSRVGDHDPSGGSLHVTDCYIDVSNAALSVADDDEYGPVNNYSIVVDGEDTYFSNYIATWSAGSSITVAEGEFSEDVYADAGTITITGGTFNNFLPDVVTGKISISGGIFDKEVPEEYCAEGYIPAVYDAETGLYTVKQGEYVAQIVRGGEVIAKYEAFDAALADAQ